MKKYDVIVIGGGHAGCEAVLASARMGVNTALVTANKDSIGHTPCNPSIGGPAKGIVVREIDALGGQMGINTDKTSLQIKMLNRSKGPAVHSLRAQVDKVLYPKEMQDTIFNTDNLEVIESMVKELIYNDDMSKVLGLKLHNEREIYAKKIIITTGTYMDSHIIKGDEKISSGPDDFETNKSLSACLVKAGLNLFKLKTGTPARVLTSSIDFSSAEICHGEDDNLAFSFYKPNYLEIDNQVPCHLIYTNANTHKIINENIGKSAMYSGVIEGVGPRYCPSIEDKLTRFADKERHQLFLEPESRYMDTTYVQGFSTSMPDDIQDLMISSLPGLENAIIDKYGYAIEYDAIKPEQLKVTLECKTIEGLYFAGQVNGTSGYEEAAGQGIVAGINAALSVLDRDPLILNRTNSYIGLMIDDLITKGTEEPYRLLTSRSEYRLYLRSDNADLRLSELGHSVGLLSDEYYNRFLKKKRQIEEVIDVMENTMVTPKTLSIEMANEFETEPLSHGVLASVFLKRPNVDYLKIKKLLDLDYKDEVIKQVEIQIKYEGYINKVKTQMSRQEKLYNAKIDVDFDFYQVHNLALEAREKLSKFKPETIGHAAQISGITPADIAVLQIYLENKRRKNDKWYNYLLQIRFDEFWKEFRTY
ncbi:MAG: tRNA uridine-5-carboxymethylaminomethyl(34) synthesis enzyme MnmG [Mycoplasmatales bacterium]